MRPALGKAHFGGDLKQQGGFTLVEMMVSMVASGIVLIGIAVIVYGSHKHIINGRSKMRLQQNFSLIEQVLAKKIRGSIQSKQKIYTDYTSYTGGGSTQASGSCIKLYYPAGDSVMIYKDNLNFKILNADLSTTNFVEGTVNNLNFVDSTRSIETGLSLLQGKWSITDTLVDAFRNFASSSSQQYETLRPMGVGTWSNNTPVGSANEWQCVDEASPDGDATYVWPSVNIDWRTDTYATGDGSGTGTIDSVVVYIRVRGPDSSDQARTVVLLSGIRYYGSIISLSGVGSYSNFSTNYTTNPNTSAAWTWADVDAMQIGVRLYRNGSTGPRCTQVWVEVYYTQ